MIAFWAKVSNSVSMSTIPKYPWGCLVNIESTEGIKPSLWDHQAAVHYWTAVSSQYPSPTPRCVLVETHLNCCDSSRSLQTGVLPEREKWREVQEWWKVATGLRVLPHLIFLFTTPLLLWACLQITPQQNHRGLGWADCIHGLPLQWLVLVLCGPEEGSNVCFHPKMCCKSL